MSEPHNPSQAANWQWWTVDKPTRVRWVLLGHTQSDDSGLEVASKTPAEIASARAKVEAFDALFAPELYPGSGQVPAYLGPPGEGPVIPPPPPPAPLTPPRAGEPCALCGHTCPR